MTEGTQLEMWTLHMDGSSNFKGSGLGIVLTSPDGDMLEMSVSYGFKATNNKAKYKAMKAGLNLVKKMGVQRLTFCSDSQLVINQMQGHYQACNNKMTAYLDTVKTLTLSFQECVARQVPRGENSHADVLANLGSATKTSMPKVIPVVYLQWSAV